MDINRMWPPAPRIPVAANISRLPNPDHLEPFGKPAADVGRAMIAVYTAADQTLDALIDGRPDGRTWRDVEDQAVQDNNPKILEDLYAGEPARYAAALVACRRAVNDQDATRTAGQKHLNTAAGKIRDHIGGLAEEFTSHAREAWEMRHRGAGAAALDTAIELHDQMRHLEALAQWCDGTTREWAATRPIPGLDPRAAGYYTAAVWRRNGTDRLNLPAGQIPPDDWQPSDHAIGDAGAIDHSGVTVYGATRTGQ
jgi:hypothetical protein